MLMKMEGSELKIVFAIFLLPKKAARHRLHCTEHLNVGRVARGKDHRGCLLGSSRCESSP